jgi:hypothetical protein
MPIPPSPMLGGMPARELREHLLLIEEALEVLLVRLAETTEQHEVGATRIAPLVSRLRASVQSGATPPNRPRRPNPG